MLQRAGAQALQGRAPGLIPYSGGAPPLKIKKREKEKGTWRFRRRWLQNQKIPNLSLTLENPVSYGFQDRLPEHCPLPLQHPNQPFSLQCEAVYEAQKMPYRILPRHLPRKELKVSSESKDRAKEARVQSTGRTQGLDKGGPSFIMGKIVMVHLLCSRHFCRGWRQNKKQMKQGILLFSVPRAMWPVWYRSRCAWGHLNQSCGVREGFLEKGLWKLNPTGYRRTIRLTK